METAALTRAQLDTLLTSIGRTRRVIGPVRREGRLFFEPVASTSQLVLDTDQPVYSIKGRLFPPRETLLTFERNGKRFVAHTHLDSTPTALVGVRPCDLHAIQLLDHVFNVDYRDTHYLARRKASLLIGLDCPGPCGDHAFCADMATNVAPSTFDMMIYPPCGDPVSRLSEADSGNHPAPEEAASSGRREWLLQIGTPVGRQCLEEAGLTLDTSVETRDRMARYQRRKHEAFLRRLNVPAERLPAILQQQFHSPVWQETARRCYSCGSCNLVCPTCYCFSIDDTVSLCSDSGSRVREWDGCQLRGFAQVAGGHDFRPDAAQRLRHRVMRKGKWIHDRTGFLGCVGCGRCDLACTAKISIRELFNGLAAEVDHVAG